MFLHPAGKGQGSVFYDCSDFMYLLLMNDLWFGVRARCRPRALCGTANVSGAIDLSEEGRKI